MRSAELSQFALMLDGQRLYAPDDVTWDALLETGSLDARPIASGRLAAQFVGTARRVSGLRVALGEEREAGKPWIVYHVARVADAPGGYARVHVEGDRCHACGTNLIIGNHRHLALYEGTDDPFAAMRARWDAPTQPCPQCGAALPRPARWVHRAGA